MAKRGTTHRPKRTSHADFFRLRWMSQQDPTDKQLNYLRTLKYQGPVLSRLDACNLIDRLHTRQASRRLTAMAWQDQGCRPIPCRAGEKKPLIAWEPYQAQDPSPDEVQRWWPNRSKANIALILGPPPGGNLLGLNINVKHGQNGWETLKRLKWSLPDTPTIQTPSGGFFLCFRVPDHPLPFKTHIHPDGFDGLEFRGTGGYQLVPPSETTDGRYTWVKPWSLDMFRADLTEPPAPMLDAWAQLDDPIRESTTTALYSPTIPTTLIPCFDSDFSDEADIAADRQCAVSLCGLLGLDLSTLDSGKAFLCRLPGHAEQHPSAMWGRTSAGNIIYKDWHERSASRCYMVPEVYAALISGHVRRLPKPSRKTWRLRLMLETGLLDPYPVAMRAIPEDLPETLKTYLQGFQLLCAAKWTYQPHAPTMFTDAFAAHWCRLHPGSTWRLRRLAIQLGFLREARDSEGQLVYLPEKDEDVHAL